MLRPKSMANSGSSGPLPAKTTWGTGDYPQMAELLLPASQVLTNVIEPHAGDRVVDLACGTGNAALLAAKKGAGVVGVDFEPALLKIASERAVAAGLTVHWLEGDLASPDLPEDAFDVVLSVFGIMYVPDQQAAAHTLAALCRPGGIIGLAAWAPNSFMPVMGRTLGPYLPPPPPGGHPPARWGDERSLSRMLEAEGIYSVESMRRELSLEFDDVLSARDFLIATAGHVVQEKGRLVEEGRWNDLLTELYTLVNENNCTPGNDVVLSLDYLISVAHKPF